MIRSTRGERLFDVCNILLLLLLGISTLYPFMYVLTISLSTPADAARESLHVLPTAPTFEAYGKIFEHPQLWRAYLNTIVRTALGVALVIVVLSLVAYPLSRRTFPHRKFITFLFVFSMLFSGGLIPTYLLIKQLHLLDTIWALVLPGAVSAFRVIILRNFFEAVPGEVIESARIDGARELTIFARIMLPLSVPVLAVIALWTAVGHWNAWFDALIYISDPDKQVLQLFLRRTVLENASLTPDQQLLDPTQYTPETLKAATIMTVSLPILLVYPFVQRYFVKGIMLGSVKG
ncbi:carbohydrate ABC transporter permease [Paenibacillus sp. IB182496]|uniref:Carbohydrate ABC transporter permease n=1 Tax=Paenibacillus sabuli TaxID=2772509 RepID=A0A927BN89_9BACL|nr:carbohydrate ABC transporter permease [Paenibacillus sabuli]MBD2843657.1 carbohydrate ABC transporter permease [Paenibacillus sabuli]